jgi:hypothetical protein
MSVYTYPPFPSSTNITTFLVQLIEWIIEIPIIAVANFFTGIAGSMTSAGESDTSSVLGFIGKAWDGSLQAFSGLGIFAPIVASLVFGIGILILIFFVFKAIQLAMRETEED